MQQLPMDYIKQSENEGLDWSEMYLGIDEIEPAKPRDSQKDADQIREDIESTSGWLGDDEEDKHIYKAIGHAEDPLEAWNDHLTEVLTFPFNAEVEEPQDRDPIKCGDKVKVHNIDDADEHYGLIVNITRGRECFVFPLCDLEVLDKTSPNYTPVKDYCVWFANR